MLIASLFVCAALTHTPLESTVVRSHRGSLHPAELRCEYQKNPIGIDEANPRLSWQEVSRGRGDGQSKYRILVATNPSLLQKGAADLWDSGEVASDETTQIKYAGKPISSAQRAWWKVWVWDHNANEPQPSQPAFWERGLPAPEDWKASWISIPVQKDARPAQYLRHDFAVRDGLISARAFVAAKGFYHFYLDGKRVDDAELLPGWTDYTRRIQYQTYDVTQQLKRGGRAHVSGIMLGDGWYSGHIGWIGANNYGSQPQALVQIELKYADASERVVSDARWVGRTGPIRANDLMMGEDFDARQQIDPARPTGWASSHAPKSGWIPVASQPLGNVPLVASASPPVRVVAHLKAKTIKEPQAGHYVFDLGQNMVGWARLNVSGPAGTKVQLRFAEMLSPDGSIYTKNLRGARATDTYILGMAPNQVFEPTFTFHGFRYVEVTGYPGVPALDAITGVVISSDNVQTGEFSCSNALVNQLQHNINWGQKGNYVSIPTDCPQRDERLGWMGDAQIFVKTATYNNDIAGFMTKWTQDVVDAQSADGGFSDVSPRMGDASDGAPAWGDAGIIVPYTIYKSYGDLELLDRRYEAMAKWVNYINVANPDHIWSNRGNNNFGDWLNVNDDTPRDVLGTAYFAYDTAIMAEVARALGKTDDADGYTSLHNDILTAFQSRFVDATGKIQGDTQTAYVIALRFGLLPEALRPMAERRLVDHILIDRKGHLSTGFVGVGYLNPTLSTIGRSDVAYRLLLNDTYPSWGYSIRQGATTIWERWDGYTKEKGFEDPGMNSFNHYALGSVGEWMYGTVAGISPLLPGYSQIKIHPVPGGDLTWAGANFVSMHGKISSHWRKLNSGFALDVVIPANTSAEVGIPSADAGGRDVVEKKNHAVVGEISGVKFLRMEGDHAVFSVQSGTYHFRSDWRG